MSLTPISAATRSWQSCCSPLLTRGDRRQRTQRLPLRSRSAQSRSRSSNTWRLIANSPIHSHPRHIITSDRHTKGVDLPRSPRRGNGAVPSQSHPTTMADAPTTRRGLHRYLLQLSSASPSRFPGARTNNVSTARLFNRIVLRKLCQRRRLREMTVVNCGPALVEFCLRWGVRTRSPSGPECSGLGGSRPLL